MELSSCPQCTTRRNIPISFSFFLTNRFHLVLSCKHCNVRYVPTMLQRIVQLILMLALSICCGLLYTPACGWNSHFLRLEPSGFCHFGCLCSCLCLRLLIGSRCVFCRGGSWKAPLRFIVAVLLLSLLFRSWFPSW